MSIEDNNAAPAADVTATPNSEPSAPSAPADALSDDTLGALFDKINAGPEAPEGDPAAPAPVSVDQPEEQVVEQAAPPPVLDAPQFWSAEMKAKWGDFSPEQQAMLAEREKKVHGTISQQGQQLSQLKPVGELRTQYQDVFDRNGVSFTDGFHTIMAMQNLLEQDPVKGLAAIAQTFDVDLAKAFGGQAQQQHQPDAQPAAAANPELSRLQTKIDKLEGILTEQQRATIAAQTAETRRLVEASAQEIAKWAEGKAHYEDLKPAMAKLFETGAADTLDEAYEMAIAKSPDIRTQIEASREAEKTAKARAEQEKAVAAAKRAAKTNAGGNRPAKTAPTGKWDSDTNLAATYDEVTAA